MNDGTPSMSVPQWWLQIDGHVVAGAITVLDDRIEAQILLDGSLLYGSRHSTVAMAEDELTKLRGQCAADGWR